MPSGEAPLPGPVPEFVFAPTEMARRGSGLWQRYARAWQTFAPIAERTMRFERVADGDGLVRVWGELLDGRTDPAVATSSIFSELRARAAGGVRGRAGSVTIETWRTDGTASWSARVPEG